MPANRILDGRYFLVWYRIFIPKLSHTLDAFATTASGTELILKCGYDKLIDTYSLTGSRLPQRRFRRWVDASDGELQCRITHACIIAQAVPACQCLH